MNRNRRDSQGSVGRCNITIRICHPQNDHEETWGRIGLGHLETRASTTVTKVPRESVGWRSSRGHSRPCQRFTGTYVSPVSQATITHAPNGWSRDRNYVDRSRQDPHRVTHNSYSIRSTIKCDQGHSVVSGHDKGMADETTAITCGKLGTITQPPVIINRPSRTCNSSVETNTSTLSNRSRKRKVNMDRNRDYAQSMACVCHGSDAGGDR